MDKNRRHYKMIYLLSVGLALIMCLTGCVHVQQSYSSCTIVDLLNSADLKLLFNGIATEMCSDKCGECRQSSGGDSKNKSYCSDGAGANPITVLVTDFVDINTYVPKPVGLLMGELMRGGLSEVCCYTIVQAEFATYFKLSDSGLVSLTRKASEVKNDEYRQGEAIVGTYDYLDDNKLLIFVKKINTVTSRISRMVTRELSYVCDNGLVTSYTVK